MPVLFLTVVIDLIGFGIILPILPFIAPKLGASELQLALLIAVHAIFSGLCGPVWGKLSDRLGRKPVLLFCLCGAAVANIALAFSTTLVALFAARILSGIMAGNFGVASAMVADMSTVENRAKAMGLMGAAFGIGMVFGPFLGGFLAGAEGDIRDPALAAAGLTILAIIAGALLLKESLTPEQRQSNRKEHKEGPKVSLQAMLRATGNRALVLQYFLQSSAISCVSYLFPLWVALKLDWTAREVGIVFGIQGLAMAIMQAGVIGWMAQRFGELKSLFGAACLMTLGFLLATFANSEQSIVIAFFVIITGATVCTPLLNSLVSKRTPLPVRGRMMGTTSAMAAWGRMFGPLFSGLALSLGGYSVSWLSGIVFTLTILWWVSRELRRNPVPELA